MTLTTRVSRGTSRLYQLLLLSGYIDDDDDDDNVDDEVCTLLVLLNPSQSTSDADLLCPGNLSLSLSLSLSLCFSLYQVLKPIGHAGVYPITERLFISPTYRLWRQAVWGQCLAQ